MAEGGEEDYDVFDPGDDMSETTPLVQGHSLRHELTLSKARSLYQSLGQETPDFIDPNDFETKDDHLFFRNDQGQLVQLTTKPNSSKFLAKSTVRQRLSVSDQNRLGIAKPPKLAPEAVDKLQKTIQELPTDRQIESMELEDLSQTSDKLIEVIEAETSLSEETALKTIHDPPLPMREIEALDRALRSIRGELTNNLAKLGELDEHIKREKEKLVEADDANLGLEVKERITQRLHDLELERSSRLELLSTNREQLRTQANRIRETVQRILYEDTTLAERIRTLFREQGITIASILTAVGFAISTLVYALTGGAPTAPPTPPTPDESWIQKKLHHLANLLKKLAAKALDALPGVIGSVVSWVLSTIGKVVGYMADHLWTLGLLAVGLIFSEIKYSKS